MWNERRSNQEGSQAKAFNSSSDDSQAQRDRARLIHSSSFRRLQSKTQVLGIGESDFYRTRLTHSLEVAQIGSGICQALREKYAQQPEVVNWLPTLSQIEAICLAHDIGHPPFGHGGEVALNFYMYNAGGFEGNGQTLRIVAKLGEYSSAQGLDLTRRTMLGLLKYPVLHKEVCAYHIELGATPLNIDAYQPPKCIHDDDVEILNWVLNGLPEHDIDEFRQTKQVKGRCQSAYKAFDTSIMELADDISYGVHDLEDALALKLVTKREWQEQVVDKLSGTDVITSSLDFYNEKLFSASNKDRKHAISKLISYFIPQITISAQNKFSTPLLDLQVSMSIEASQTLDILKQFVYKRVIKSAAVQAFEYKGQQMILKLFEVLQANPSRLLPEATYQKYCLHDNPPRVICDYISGMTDNYATKLYHKLFSPDMGSIFDRM